MQGNLQGLFDATLHNPEQGDGQLPVGRHPVVIERSEVKATKAGDSGMLVLHLKVLDGEHKGATGPLRLNIFNKNPEAVAIAHRELSAICHCTGLMQIQDSSQLHGKQFMVQVQAQKSNPEYTEISKILDISGQPPRRGQASAPAAPVAVPAAAAPVAPAPDTPAPVAPQGWGATPAAPAPAAAPTPAAAPQPWNANGAAPAAAPGGPLPWQTN